MKGKTDDINRNLDKIKIKIKINKLNNFLLNLSNYHLNISLSDYGVNYM